MPVWSGSISIDGNTYPFRVVDLNVDVKSNTVDLTFELERYNSRSMWPIAFDVRDGKGNILLEGHPSHREGRMHPTDFEFSMDGSVEELVFIVHKDDYTYEKELKHTYQIKRPDVSVQDCSVYPEELRVGDILTVELPISNSGDLGTNIEIKIYENEDVVITDEEYLDKYSAKTLVYEVEQDETGDLDMGYEVKVI